MEGIQLEVGKFYENELGDVIEITDFVDSGYWIFYFGHNNSVAYRPNGRAMAEGDASLVKEVTT